MNWEVTIDKPMKTRVYCIWEDRIVTEKTDNTVAVISAGNEEKLKDKLKKLYPNDRIVSYRKVHY